MKVAAQMRNLLTWLRDEVPSLVSIGESKFGGSYHPDPSCRSEGIHKPGKSLFVGFIMAYHICKNCVTVSQFENLHYYPVVYGYPACPCQMILGKPRVLMVSRKNERLELQDGCEILHQLVDGVSPLNSWICIVS